MFRVVSADATRFFWEASKGEGWFLVVRFHTRIVSFRWLGQTFNGFFPLMPVSGYLMAAVLTQQGKNGITDDRRLLPQNEVTGIRHAHDCGPTAQFPFGEVGAGR
jgi:hypothetical protein